MSTGFFGSQYQGSLKGRISSVPIKSPTGLSSTMGGAAPSAFVSGFGGKSCVGGGCGCNDCGGSNGYARQINPYAPSATPIAAQQSLSPYVTTIDETKGQATTLDEQSAPSPAPIGVPEVAGGAPDATLIDKVRAMPWWVWALGGVAVIGVTYVVTAD